MYKYSIQLQPLVHEREDGGVRVSTQRDTSGLGQVALQNYQRVVPAPGPAVAFVLPTPVLVTPEGMPVYR